jgi:hypothetical protein
MRRSTQFFYLILTGLLLSISTQVQADTETVVPATVTTDAPTTVTTQTPATVTTTTPSTVTTDTPTTVTTTVPVGTTTSQAVVEHVIVTPAPAPKEVIVTPTGYVNCFKVEAGWNRGIWAAEHQVCQYDNVAEGVAWVEGYWVCDKFGTDNVCTNWTWQAGHWLQKLSVY